MVRLLGFWVVRGYSLAFRARGSSLGCRVEGRDLHVRDLIQKVMGRKVSGTSVFGVPVLGNAQVAWNPKPHPERVVPGYWLGPRSRNGTNLTLLVLFFALQGYNRFTFLASLERQVSVRASVGHRV